MHVVRAFVILFLILAIMVACSPQTRDAWYEARPLVIQVMDSLYATIRNFVAGGDPHEGIDSDPPGVDFEIIITRGRDALL